MELPKKRPKSPMTVDIDDELLERARVFARSNDITLRLLVELGLEHMLKKHAKPSNPPSDEL